MFNHLANKSLIDQEKLEPLDLGLGPRIRQSNYPEIAQMSSIYYQQANITTTERSFGMPLSSGQNIFTRLSSPSALQVSSTSVNDTSAGTGARSIYIDGLVYNGGKWRRKTSVVTNLNGQTTQQIGTDTDWYRINKVWVNSSGSGQTNAGHIYISPLGQSTTSGLPNANILHAIINGYSNSTGGFFSVPYKHRFNYCFGNFYSGVLSGSNNTVIYHEFFYQDFNGTGDTNNMTKYEVGKIMPK